MHPRLLKRNFNTYIIMRAKGKEIMLDWVNRHVKARFSEEERADLAYLVRRARLSD